MPFNPAYKGATKSLRPRLPGPAGVPTWSRRVGEWGAFVFAAFALVGTSPASVGLAVLTLAYLWNFRDWRVLIQDPLIQACLAFAGIAYSFRLRALIADTRAGEASIFENADSPA